MKTLNASRLSHRSRNLTAAIPPRAASRPHTASASRQTAPISSLKRLSQLARMIIARLKRERRKTRHGTDERMRPRPSTHGRDLNSRGPLGTIVLTTTTMTPKRTICSDFHSETPLTHFKTWMTYFVILTNRLQPAFSAALSGMYIWSVSQSSSSCHFIIKGFGLFYARIYHYSACHLGISCE